MTCIFLFLPIVYFVPPDEDRYPEIQKRLVMTQVHYKFDVSGTEKVRPFTIKYASSVELNVRIPVIIVSIRTLLPWLNWLNFIGIEERRCQLTGQMFHALSGSWMHGWEIPEAQIHVRRHTRLILFAQRVRVYCTAENWKCNGCHTDFSYLASHVTDIIFFMLSGGS